MSESVADRLLGSVLHVTKDWAKQRKAEERHASAEANREARLIRASDYYNFKSASFEVMEKAYLLASADGTLPAMARQVMYQARPMVQELMGGRQLDDQYFCQTLLPDYVSEYEVDWDVVYDDRGHFVEPHTGHTIGLGTLSVREYLESLHEPELIEASFAPARIDTRGPDGCFGAVLFTEKEGFFPLFEAVHLAERFDIAIKSTKGMSNTAARQLADEMCGGRDIPLFVLHDFDKSGFSIFGTLNEDNRRYEFSNHVEVIDLGLRLKDVERLGLQPEQAFDKGREGARRWNLKQNGATPKEIEFLLHQRVELNALTSDQLVTFIEDKLQQHGVKKIVPDREMLDETYRLFACSHNVEKIIKRELKKLASHAGVKPPSNLSTQVRQYLAKHPTVRWDEGVSAIVKRK
jgi:hypothetical protein